MSKILLQTTIEEHPDDWDISRFSLLADELRCAGHDVVARNRANRGGDDPVLSRIDELDYDQLWLMAVDVGDGLTDAEAEAIVRFRENGGGVLTARDHEDLGRCLLCLGSIGMVNQFHDDSVDPTTRCDDQDTPTISWPNYHSGANGDYQRIGADPDHELLRSPASPSGVIEFFPAHPHEGAVGVPEDEAHARVVAVGKSQVTGRQFNLVVAFENSADDHGNRLGRGIAESSFHHFVDYNWDTEMGCPSFLIEPPGDGYKRNPEALRDIRTYVSNAARWLAGR